MAATSDNSLRPWEPFGVSEADFRGVPERDGVRVVNVRPGGDGAGAAGWWLGSAAVVLAVLAAAAAVVSWDAQFTMVAAVKHTTVVAALEAGIPDAGAVIFAALGVALALHGSRAVRPAGAERHVHRDLARDERAGGRAWLAGPGDLGDARRGVRRGIRHPDRGGPRLGAGPRPR